MKKLLPLLLLIVILSIVPHTFAQQTGFDAIAAQVPANTFMFFAMRTDDAIVVEIESLAALALDEMPEGDRPESLQSLLDELIVPEYGLDTQTLLDWFGDTAGIAVFADENEVFDLNNTDVLAVFEIDNRAELEAFVLEQAEDDLVPRKENGNVYYENADEDVSVLFTDDYLYVGTLGVDPLSLPSTLGTLPAYTDIMGSLPEDSYNLVAYYDFGQIIPDIDGAASIGFTMLDGRSLIIDSVLAPTLSAVSTVPLTPINPDFMVNIPASADAVMQSTDLAASYEKGIGSLSPLEQMQFESILDEVRTATGIDLQRDFFQLVESDYAIMMGVDLLPIILGAMREELNIDGAIDFGIIFDSSAGAAEVSRLPYKMLQYIDRQLVPTGLVTISDENETIGGMSVSTITVTIPMDASTMLSLDFLLGSNQDIFMLATRDLGTDILERERSITETAMYAEVTEYTLPNPTSLYYGNSQGVVTGMGVPIIVVLAILGPTVGEIFEDIIEELEADGNAANEPQFRTVQNDPTTEALRYFGVVMDTISSGSISTAVNPDGSFAQRIVLTINR